MDGVRQIPILDGDARQDRRLDLAGVHLLKFGIAPVGLALFEPLAAHVEWDT